MEQLNGRGDVSPNGLKQSGGMMVNCAYRLDEIEKNHEAFGEEGKVAMSSTVKGLVRS